MWFSVEHYYNTHSTQYRCTHYTQLSTARCFQSVCNSVTPCCVILFSTNSSPLIHPPVHFPPEPHQSQHPPPHPAGTFSWNADCKSVVCQISIWPSMERTRFAKLLTVTDRTHESIMQIIHDWWIQIQSWVKWKLKLSLCLNHHALMTSEEWS
jgi:hypothetical protein